MCPGTTDEQVERLNLCVREYFLDLYDTTGEFHSMPVRADVARVSVRFVERVLPTLYKRWLLEHGYIDAMGVGCGDFAPTGSKPRNRVPRREAPRVPSSASSQPERAPEVGLAGSGDVSQGDE